MLFLHKSKILRHWCGQPRTHWQGTGKLTVFAGRRTNEWRRKMVVSSSAKPRARVGDMNRTGRSQVDETRVGSRKLSIHNIMASQTTEKNVLYSISLSFINRDTFLPMHTVFNDRNPCRICSSLNATTSIHSLGLPKIPRLLL